MLYKDPVPSLHEGDEFAGHRILGIAGRGGMGVVYRALQLDLDRPVALKLIAPQLAEDPDFRQRFVRESRAAASIDHPNVIPIYYTGESDDGSLYIAMRYVEGSDLRTLVRAAQRLDPPRAAYIVSQVARALDAAHARGIVHRDVKPANVLLGANDHAYLTDFGLTKRVTSHTGSTRDGGWVGTLGYVAPEQIRGERLDARADVYALGCVLYHSLAGVPPYQRESDEATLWAHLNDDPPTLHDRAPDVPASFDAVLARAMAKDPDDRFPSAGDLGRAALAAAGEPVAPGPERVVAVGEAAPGDHQETVVSPDQAPTVLAASAPAARRWWPWALAVVPIAGLALIAALALGGGDKPGTTTSGSTGTDTTPSPQKTAIKSIDVGGRPNNIVLASGKAWVVRSGNERLVVIDAETAKREPYSPRVGDPSGEAAGFDKLWVINQAAPSLVPIGLKSHRQEGQAVPLPAQGRAVAVAAGSNAMWVGVRGNPGLLLRIDPKNRAQPAKTIELPDGLQNIAVGGGAVWVIARRRNTVTRLDIASGTQRPIFVGEKPTGIAYGRGAVWVTNYGDDTVTRIDSGSLNTGIIETGNGPKGVAVGAGAVWVANSLASTVTRIDPQSNRPSGDPISVALNPYGVDTNGNDVWITSPSDGKVQRLTPSG
ncbi:MAG TPA: serine/threonine-protein kinase [Solirubrobacteraceae bacterium]|nr:serine/threonine-protein kinase [Solirubrobacteraceae bacterium]